MPELIVAKNFDNGTTQAQGNEICMGSLDKDQISEIVSLLKKGTYLESDYFQSFFNYNDLYHGNGILLCEYEDIYNSSDMDSLSKGDWEFLEGEEEISDVSVKDGIFLITCRIQEVYFNARLESSDIVESAAVKLTALCDLLSPMDNIPWDNLSESCAEPPRLLFKGVKCKYGEFERDPGYEEGGGYIYNTYQFIFNKDKLLLFISNRDGWEAQFPFSDTEDYCPYMAGENELDQDRLNNCITKLEKLVS